MHLQPKTWRWQLVLIMILVSGLSLGAFIAVFWPTVSISNYKKFDAELTSAALTGGLPFLTLFNPQGPPPRLPGNTPGDIDSDAAAFAFHDMKDGRTHPSRNWPAGVDVQFLSQRIVDLYPEQGIEFPEPPRLGPEESNRGDNAWRPQPPPGAPPPALKGPRLERTVFDTVQFEGQSWRVLGFSDGTRVFLALQSLAPVQAEMADLAQALYIAVPIALVFVGIAAWFLAWRAIAPVRRLVRSAAGITAEALDERLAARDEPVEFAELIEVYNRMLDRLEKSFQQARRFSADAAHELNTPLTILKGHLDELLQSAEPESTVQRQVAGVLEETQRLEDIIAKLLLLSQADSGRLPFTPVRMDFSQDVSEILEDVTVMAPELSFKRDIAPGLQVDGDPSLLRQCVFNLLSNAVKYNGAGGFIDLSLSRAGESVRLEVANSGRQIPVDQAGRLFDRFYRADSSRNRDIEGRGLGLSLAHEFARVHQGELSLVANEADRIVFRLDLPGSA